MWTVVISLTRIYGQLLDCQLLNNPALSKTTSMSRLTTMLTEQSSYQYTVIGFVFGAVLSTLIHLLLQPAWRRWLGHDQVQLVPWQRIYQILRVDLVCLFVLYSILFWLAIICGSDVVLK